MSQPTKRNHECYWNFRGISPCQLLRIKLENICRLILIEASEQKSKDKTTHCARYPHLER